MLTVQFVKKGTVLGTSPRLTLHVNSYLYEESHCTGHKPYNNSSPLLLISTYGRENTCQGPKVEVAGGTVDFQL